MAVVPLLSLATILGATETSVWSHWTTLHEPKSNLCRDIWPNLILKPVQSGPAVSFVPSPCCICEEMSSNGKPTLAGVLKRKRCLYRQQADSQTL